MTFETFRSRLRNLIARRFGRVRGRRERLPQTPAADLESAPPSESTPAPALAPSLDVAQIPVPATPVVIELAAVPLDIVAPTAPTAPTAAPEALLTPVPSVEILVPLAPGRFETDAELGVRPKLYDAPTKRREFMVYLPAGWSAEVRAPLIVLCHGCKQTPEEFAKGSRIAALADQLGCVVLIPRQTRWANPWRCWNWFDLATMSGGGEAEIVAAQVRLLRRRYRTDPRRVVAVGISAGAALAAVLGICHPRQVRAVVTHSGVACGAANTPMSAGEVMLRGPNADVEAIGAQARAKASSALPVPLLAIHGENDTVISPANSIALVRQYLHFNGHPAVSADSTGQTELPHSNGVATTRTAEGREVTTREWRIDGRLTVRHISIGGLGHAWSGGDDTVAFNDRHAPDASQLVGDFIAEVLPRPADTRAPAQ